MLPFRIGPLIWAAIIAVAIAATMIGLVHLADELVESGKATEQKAQLQREADAKTQAEQQARDAETAREGAKVPGSLARLRANWCTNCPEAR